MLQKISKTAGLICFIHCTILPVCISILPLIGFSFIMNRWVDLAILGTAVLGTGLSLCYGFPKHKSPWPFLLFFGALIWFYSAHQVNREIKHIIMILLAGFYFIGANWLNNKYCKSCSSCKSRY